MLPKLIASMSLLATAGCVTAPLREEHAAALAAIRSADGTSLGTVSLVASGDGYRLTGDLSGLAPGQHGVHLHTAGLCDGPDFTTAGGHLNPGLHQHGSMNPAGTHLGDLPNIVADGDGAARLTLDLRGTRAALERDLFDGDGTALVIHAGPDDYRTDPSGNSGKRVACGMFVKQP